MWEQIFIAKVFNFGEICSEYSPAVLCLLAAARLISRGMGD